MMNQHNIIAMFHEINPLVLALVISPVHLSGDEGISHEHKCEYVHFRVNCAKYQHGFFLVVLLVIGVKWVCVMQTKLLVFM